MNSKCEQKVKSAIQVLTNRRFVRIMKVIFKGVERNKNHVQLFREPSFGARRYADLVITHP